MTSLLVFFSLEDWSIVPFNKGSTDVMLGFKQSNKEQEKQ